MDRNPNLYIPKLPSEEVDPGCIVCSMAAIMGFHIGTWRVWVIIDQNKSEYNTSVSIFHGSYFGISKEQEEQLNAEGISLTDKELKTILSLYQSRRFKEFSKSAPAFRFNDSSISFLRIRSSTEIVYLAAENFNFYRRNRIRLNSFQLKCLWWTRGLKYILQRMQH